MEETGGRRENRGKPVPPEPVKPQRPKDHSFWPGTIYNAKIAPLTHFAIRGVIWYQGEGNAANKYGLADIYSVTFSRMIQDWRAQWDWTTFRSCGCNWRRSAGAGSAGRQLLVGASGRSAAHAGGDEYGHGRDPGYRRSGQHPSAEQAGCRRAVGAVGAGEDLWEARR